ncbi:hypothetical protein C8F04DRAFT_1195895 [Mycena alexandri]|uniref:Uncharacterized protein n=1 Tax=Mycena alexandri TaxID=1745969 RepID=A0AAD6WQ61_9AGAR|nr:hypothetical protein C8F04DRAFT_1195895 [Mycena alexandri]
MSAAPNKSIEIVFISSALSTYCIVASVERVLRAIQGNLDVEATGCAGGLILEVDATGCAGAPRALPIAHMSTPLPPQQIGCAAASTLPAGIAIPGPTASDQEGDLALISDGNWQMYSARSGEWIAAQVALLHPTLKEMRLAHDCRWVNRHTVSEHKKRKQKDGSIEKSISDNPELESSTCPATRRHEESPVPGDMVNQSVVSVVNISPTNVFAVELGQRWRSPPLSYYTMVSEKTVVILDRLAQWPTVPSYDVVPAGSLVLADLIAMGDDLINYHKLSAEAETVREPVSAVLDMHLKSTLMEPWRLGKRIVLLLNISATDKGMLKCRLDWNALLEQLGPQFAFADYDWMYAEAELGKLFPFTSTKKGGKVRVDAERTEYLKERGKGPWVASVRTAPGWLSEMHIDFAGLASGIAHIDGEKLWLFWPPTPNNLRCCVAFAHATHWDFARTGLEFCKTLVHNPDYAASRSIALVDQVVNETPIWRQAMGEESVAATYLAEWKQDTAAIYNDHNGRDISAT